MDTITFYKIVLPVSNEMLTKRKQYTMYNILDMISVQRINQLPIP